MSWHKQTHRMTFIHQAILTALFGLVSLQAHAITLSQADIHSSQHEPLSATINVSDIDAKNFNVSIATADIYAQMGLNPEAPISVQFNATSDTSGQIILTSTTPISTPFADVVLNLNNNGEQVIEPQTLLMPIPASSPFLIPENEASPVVVSEGEQNLPTVTPLVAELPAVDDNPQSEQIEATAKPNKPTPELSKPTTDNVPSGKVISQADEVIAQITPEGTNKQVDILTEHVTKRVYPAGQAPQGDTSTTTIQEPALTQTPKTEAEPTSTGNAVYVVQSGDSLWNIANQIAKANNMSVGEVMNTIHSTNPDAFNKGNINQLKTHAKLNLPNYSVIPSQKAIQDAISTKRHHDSKPKGNSGHVAKAPKGTQSNRTNNNNSTASTRKPLPRAQMTLVTPSQQGKATGTNNRPTQNQTNGGNALVGTLKSTRQQTVNTAQRVNGLNQELSTATQKLQLQNQKLAELEARLKALKENQ